MAHILQRVQNAEMTFTAFEYRSDLYSAVRANFGLTEGEFLEFVTQTYFERPNIFLVGYEGELPEPEATFSKVALKAQAAQKSRKAAR
jgi:hypothetical protein